MIVKLKYLSRERSGLFLYFRQIPADLRHPKGESFVGNRFRPMIPLSRRRKP
jgi:hypothetical protein